jgi:hypothetical protein
MNFFAPGINGADEGNSLPMKRKTLWIVGSISTLSLITLAIVLMGISQLSATEWYTSPPLDAKGTRVKFQIPAGWKVDALWKATTEYSFYVVSPPARSFTLPFGIRIPWQNTEDYGVIYVIGKPPREKPHSPFDDLDPNHWAYTAVPGSSSIVIPPRSKSREIRVKPDNYPLTLNYTDTNQARFERLNHTIIDSLTVLP